MPPWACRRRCVVAKNAPTPPEFYGNFHMAMFDYEFVVVQPLKKGRHTFYVINRGSQTHQASLVRLNPGASAEDVLAALNRTDRFPPGEIDRRNQRARAWR